MGGPYFVAGTGRCGTSQLVRVLGEHPEVHALRWESRFLGDPGGGITAINPEAWDRVLKVNLEGVIATMAAAARVMKEQRSGRIVVTASTNGTRSAMAR